MCLKNTVGCIAFYLAALVPTVASAAVQVNATRIIYPVGERSVTVNVVNTGEVPHLVKTWVDDGDASVDPSKVSAPFLVTPPLARIEPERGQALRLMYLGSDHARDRETVYYINILDVPPAADRSNSATLQFAVRTRLKIFLRPPGLPGKPEQAAKMLTWTVSGEGGKRSLTAHNASAYNVSLASVTLPDGTVLDGKMVAPFSTHSFAVSVPLPTDAHLSVKWVSDHGGLITQESQASSAAVSTAGQ